MELILAAKSTKPGSKANARRGSAAVNGKPARVPVGVLHFVDVDAQSGGGMYEAVCGESSLIGVDASIDDEFPNERCAVCDEFKWAGDFNEMQKGLLK